MAKLKTTNPYGTGFFDDQPSSARPTPTATAPVRPGPDSAQASPAGGLAPPSTDRPRLVRLNVDVDRSLYRDLKRLAIDRDTTVAALIRDLVERLVRGDGA